MKKSTPKVNDQITGQQVTVIQELPYAEIIPSGRAELRELSSGRGREILIFNSKDVALNPGFNWRQPSPYQTYEEWMLELEIPELAAGIFASNGPVDPIQGDLPKGGDKVLITEGQRRFMAIEYLLAQGKTHYPNGKEIGKIEILPNPTTLTAFERERMIINSQKKQKLKPSQKALGYKRMKNTYQLEEGKILSNQEIADLHGDISRQYVDYMLILAEMNPETMRKVDTKELTLTDAVAQYRAEHPVKPQKIVKVNEETGEIMPDDNPLSDKVFVPGGFQALDPNATTRAYSVIDQLTQERLIAIANIVAGEGTHGISNVLPDDETRYVFLHDKTDDILSFTEDKDILYLELSKGDEGMQLFGSNVKELIVKYVKEQNIVCDGVRFLDGIPILNHDTESYHEAETASRITDPNYKEAPPIKDYLKDAMMLVDFKDQKTEAEMNLSECIKSLDKLEVRIATLPENLKQYKDDFTGIIVMTRLKLTDTLEIVKKAPERGE